MTHPDARVSTAAEEEAVPVRLNVLKERDRAKALDARWTPTAVFLDGEGRVHHRLLGFLPPDEFIPQVRLAAGHAHLAAGRFDEAELRYRRAVEEHPDADAAPEALYWSGVARFRRTKSTQPIYDACRELVRRWPNHLWAKKVGFVTKYENFDLK